jgi:CRISPR-associated protein Csm1
MPATSLLEQSSRVALAAFLHDLGKFAERARLKVPQDILDTNKQLYCPHHKKYTDDRGWFSHVHAAYTGLAMDVIEKNLPPLTGENLAPFGSWKTRDADDSFINAAAKHHRPDSFLQWVIATADRVASGFDREQFAEYNQGEDKTKSGKNHYTARQLTLFEQIHRADMNETEFKYRYPLRALSPDSLFPVKAEDCESADNDKAQKEYAKLWEQFVTALDKLPESHRQNWALWLDHFETVWGVYTHSIPSATAFNVRPDVSLYDHSRVTAALATALWRYHHERGDTGNDARKQLADQGSSWQEKKFLLIQGDFFGIQDFIFASGGETNKRAAKLLRGRSFYVSLLTECAALMILDELDLPSTSQVINAAGKFMIVAPNTPATLEKLAAVRQRLDDWFLQYSWGQAGVGIAWTEATCHDFRRGGDAGQESPYQKLIKRLFEQLEIIKNQRFNLCGQLPTPMVFSDFLSHFHNDKGVCRIDGRSPASRLLDNEVWISELANDQINIGGWLAHPDKQRILITRNSMGIRSALNIPVFGYHISFVPSEDVKGKFGHLAKTGELLRAWDFSLPRSSDQALWNGYARRNINAYVPLFDTKSDAETELKKYGNEEIPPFAELKTLNHIACEDKVLTERHTWQGISALSTLKGDVDNLGQIFQSGLGPDSSFSKTAALSRQINAFFAIYLPWLCQTEYQNTYTVFAGGDDFFLIGPWLSQIKLAQVMRQKFKDYVAHNDQVHFSAGISTTKPGLPVSQFGDMAEHALEQAKAHNPQQHIPAPKNAVSCFNQVMFWDEFVALLGRSERLDELSEEFNLSTGYVYGLLNLIDMAEQVKTKPHNAIWHSYFAYRTVRMLERNKKLEKPQIKRRQAELAEEIVNAGIERHGGNYRVALFCHLYQQRD